VTTPIWLDAAGRRRSTFACWTCGRETAPMRYRAENLCRHGWTPPQTLHIPDWCGCTTEYLPPVPDFDFRVAPEPAPASGVDGDVVEPGCVADGAGGLLSVLPPEPVAGAQPASGLAAPS
jgi:hypothetical protein